MTKQVFVDSAALEKALSTTKESSYGLLVGQTHADDKDSIYLFAPTPPRKQPKGKASSGVFSVDATWTTEHAVQIRRLLPGGVYVVGIYTLIGSRTFPSNLESAVASLSSVCQDRLLSSIYNKEDFDKIGHHHNLILNICPHSKIITGRMFDLGDTKGRPLEAKAQPISQRLCRFESNIKLAFEAPLSSNLPKSAFQQILNGVSSLATALDSSIASVDGRIPSVDQEISAPSTGEKRSKQKREDQLQEQTRSVEFLTTFPEFLFNSEDKQSAAVKARFHGTIHAVAFGQSRQTFANVLQFLKQDVLQSLCTRLELLVLLAEGDDGNPFLKKANESQEFAAGFLEVGFDPLPRRVEVKSSQLLSLFDHISESDDQKTVSSRLQELVGLDFDKDSCLMIHLENSSDGHNTVAEMNGSIAGNESVQPIPDKQAANEQELKKLDAPRNSDPSTIAKSKSSNTNLICAVLFVLLAIALGVFQQLLRS
eukprot:TRINITY_DN9503_c0_g1_i2.p1 TRINITY_DN9503_c0_g1~~TRINITY_DN9503_c0_g1_i2.p1  ORF type:complete len:482 (+),score=95.89 TRINITY_DN9503_c0_g1_i2:48-1493(+)